jgi:hypothetical protein
MRIGVSDRSEQDLGRFGLVASSPCSAAANDEGQAQTFWDWWAAVGSAAQNL